MQVQNTIEHFTSAHTPKKNFCFHLNRIYETFKIELEEIWQYKESNNIPPRFQTLKRKKYNFKQRTEKILFEGEKVYIIPFDEKKKRFFCQYDDELTQLTIMNSQRDSL